jgi:DNA-binding NtrC family response regulator
MGNQEHTILLVDDEPVSLKMLEKLLSRNYTVVTASNGFEALEILSKQEISLIISDHHMPGMSGVELLGQCRTLYPDVIRMLTTANKDVDTYLEAIKRSGAIRVIHKPLNVKNVMSFVEEALVKQEASIMSRTAYDQLEQAIAQVKRAAEGLAKLRKQE